MALRPTFYGFEMARTAIMASQKSTDVTGQNIANINTPGYSRQQAILTSKGAGNMDWKYALPAHSNIGLGVNVDSIARMRDQFIDVRYWRESGDLSDSLTRLEGAQQIEDVLDEVTRKNLGDNVEEIFKALQNVSSNTNYLEMMGLVRAAAKDLVTTLNTLDKDLVGLQDDQLLQLDTNFKDINSALEVLNEYNKEIKKQSLIGVVSNELLDKRDELLDKLSAYGDIDVTWHDNGGVSVDMGGLSLLDSTTNTIRWVGYDKATANYPTDELVISTAEWPATGVDPVYDADMNLSRGELKAHLNILNGKGSYATGTENNQKGLLYFKGLLNDFASTFAEVFNTINDISGADDPSAEPLFVDDSGTVLDITAGNIRLSEGWLGDPLYLNSTREGTGNIEGKNDNIMRFIDTFSKKHPFDKVTGTYQDFILLVVTDAGSEVNYFDQLSEMNLAVHTAIADQRDSVMGVNLDEETINMQKFNRAYQAASRFMTTLDEQLDMIINRMGKAGL